VTDTPRCYRVFVWDPRHRTHWSPRVTASDEAEARAKAEFMYPAREVRQVQFIHDFDDHWAIEQRQTLIERRRAA
jgi:hypothetical protein